MQELDHCTRLAAVRQPLPAVAVAAVVGLPELRLLPRWLLGLPVPPSFRFDQQPG